MIRKRTAAQTRTTIGVEKATRDRFNKALDKWSRKRRWHEPHNADAFLRVLLELYESSSNGHK